MFKIDDLFDNDALFFFMDGFRNWLKVEFERCDVETLDAASDLWKISSVREKDTPAGFLEDLRALEEKIFL